MFKKAEKTYLCLNELKIGYFLVFLFLGLCSCQSVTDFSQLDTSQIDNTKVTLNPGTKCPDTPSGSLTNPQMIDIDKQAVQKTGKISSDDDIGFLFEGQKGQKLSYSYNDRLCVWIYTPDNKLLSGVELPVSGNYAVHLASLEGTTTFEIEIKLSEPINNKKVTSNSEKKCPDIPPGNLTNPQMIDIDRQAVQKTGKISSDDDIEFLFKGKKGQKLSYRYNDQLCVWIYTPDKKLLSGVELPMNGNYTVHLASLKGTTTFEIEMKLSEPNTETIPNTKTTKVIGKKCDEPLDDSYNVKANGLNLVDCFQTNSNQIFIYKKKGKLYYHGIQKTGNNDSIFLPANQYGEGYIAINKTYKYIINNSHLSVYKGKNLLKKQPVIQ
ncbi:MAG: hypothetical protein F6K54_18035 [Okeania sp. SIO3B5]|uniref:hypothetical protein n=1 Tax=Okeania sp. SIO3B5 TaxID=2607811 RepID=UPI0013FF937F|nr:hypothetical protein [Okeania sp. SIO3B5]NEO54814.1 hypothetical protein [Okeania sp. SIO3B5]